MNTQDIIQEKITELEKEITEIRLRFARYGKNTKTYKEAVNDWQYSRGKLAAYEEVIELMSDTNN